MRRQENTYEKVSDTKYRLRITGKDEIVLTFDTGVYESVKLYKWSHRGKGVIKNDFNDTFGSVAAYLYGYADGEWTRKTADGDYTASNFILRVDAVCNHTSTQCIKEFDDMGVPFHTRVKYRSKHETTSLTVQRLGCSHSVTILINTFMVQYVPTLLRVCEGRILCKDGTPLKVLLLKKLGVAVDVTKYWSHTNISNEFDLRVDSNDLTFVSRLADKTRYHFIQDDDTGDRYVVIETQENTINTRFRWLPDINDKWRVPYGHTINERRVAYVIVDEDVYERIDDVFYDDRSREWMVRDSESSDLTDAGFIRPTQLKRLVGKLAGLQIDNVYIAPEPNARYAAAMECTADLSSVEGRKAARTRALYENHSSLDKGKSMYKPAKLVKRRHVVADKQYFCTSIYGGVGVWCCDMRKCSIRVRGITSPEQDTAVT